MSTEGTTQASVQFDGFTVVFNYGYDAAFVAASLREGSKTSARRTDGRLIFLSPESQADADDAANRIEEACKDLPWEEPGGRAAARKKAMIDDLETLEDTHFQQRYGLTKAQAAKAGQ